MRITFTVDVPDQPVPSTDILIEDVLMQMVEHDIEFTFDIKGNMTRAELFKVFYNQGFTCRIGRSLIHRADDGQMIVVDWGGRECKVYGTLAAFNMFCRINGITK